jgi:hypothetical protein
MKNYVILGMNRGQHRLQGNSSVPAIETPVTWIHPVNILGIGYPIHRTGDLLAVHLKCRAALTGAVTAATNQITVSLHVAWWQNTVHPDEVLHPVVSTHLLTLCGRHALLISRIVTVTWYSEFYPSPWHTRQSVAMGNNLKRCKGSTLPLFHVWIRYAWDEVHCIQEEQQQQQLATAEPLLLQTSRG